LVELFRERSELKRSRWYVRTFEKMGWMILALHDGDLDKLSHYLKKISRLIRALDLKASKTRDVDRARDLRLMSKNAVVLFEDVSRVVQRGANVRRRH
jgi:hypothetical protein